MKHRLTAILTTAVMAVSSLMLPSGSDISDWMHSLTKAEAYESIEAYPDFSLDMYVADLMTNASKDSHSYEMLSYYVNEADSPNTIIFELLRDDESFRNSVNAWEAVNAVFDPGEETTKKLDEVGYYEAIILNALNASFQSDEFYSDYMKKAYGITNSIYSYFEDNLELTYFINDYKNLTDSELDDFGDAFKEAFEKSYPELSLFSDSMKIIKEFFTVCNTLYELVDKIVAYYICNQMSDEMKQLVHDLNACCSGTQNPAMKLALSNIETACDSYELAIADAVSDTTFKVGAQTLSKVGDKFMKSCIAYFPEGKAILLTQAITKSAVNFILSTDKIIEQYYKMERLYEFEMLMRSVLRSQMTGYQASPSEDNAKLLFATVDVFFNTYDISCQYATDYEKILFEENIIGKYFGNTNQYNELTESIRYIRSMAATEHDLLRNYYYLWILECEYPEIYAAYCEQTSSSAVTFISALGVEFTKDTIEIGLEDDFGRTNATVQPTNASNQQITYKSSNPEIADCSYGTIYPYAVGTTVITATTVDGGHTATLTVNVVEGHGEDGSYLEPTLIGTAKVGDTFEIGGLTYKVTSETEVSVTDCDEKLSGHLYIPENVGYYGNMFEVTEIGNKAFGSCWNLTSVEIPDSVTSIGQSAFECCYDLTGIVIPDSVIKVGTSAFSSCKSLETVTIGASVTDCDPFVFHFCTNVKKLVFSDGITAINSNMIGDMKSSLEEVIIPDSVTIIGVSTFKNCKKLTNIELPPNLTVIENECFAGCTGLTSIKIPASVLSIGQSAFLNCLNLTSIVIPDLVTEVNSNTFSGCKSLETVTIGASVTDFSSSAFFYCGNIKKLIFSDGITAINSNMTNYMESSLEEVIIPDSVTSIGSYTFQNCTKLTSIYLPPNITTIESQTFYNCSGLTSIVIPDGVTSIGSYAFYNCSSLTSVVIPDSVTYVGEYAFKSCGGLETVTVGASVISFGYAAFSGCNIKALIFSDGIQEINSSMTNNMESSLEEVIIPDSVTSIGSSTFHNCTALTDVYFFGSEMQWNEIAIGTSNESLDTATIHFNYVPPQGDVNLDGTFSIADVVMMQRYLLAKGSLTYWQAGDVCEDQHLDAFDLCIMKKMLLSK